MASGVVLHSLARTEADQVTATVEGGSVACIEMVTGPTVPGHGLPISS